MGPERITQREVSLTENNHHCMIRSHSDVELKTTTTKPELVTLAAGQGWSGSGGQMGAGGQRYQTCGYQIDMPWGCHVQCGDLN